MSKIIVFITAKDKLQAHTIAQKLLEAKLIACANIIDGVSSLYWWQGKIDQSEETMLVLKTRISFLKKIVKLVKAAHTYEVPEVIALPVLGGNPDYLKWVDQSLK